MAVPLLALVVLTAFATALTGGFVAEAPSAVPADNGALFRGGEPWLVVNEIQADGKRARTGDWVEIANNGPGDANLGGYKLVDRSSNPALTLPEGVVLSEGGYLVVAQNVTALYEEVQTSAVGDFGFGLSRKGDALSLLDPRGGIVDSVTWENRAPWPIAEAGATLELRDPRLLRTDPANWALSVEPGGTPGEPNSATQVPPP